MKLIHLSDLHLGKRVNEVSMIEDQKYILEEIRKIIRAEKPDGVLISGDVYDRPVPPAEAVELFDDFLADLAKEKLQVFIISGNHDSAERIAFGSRIFKGAGIYISPVYGGHIDPITLEDGFGKVQFYLLPFVKPAHVRRFFPDREIVSYTDAIRAAVEDMQVSTAERNVLLTHQFVTGAETCQSEELSVGGTDNVDASVFDPFDYVALGHLHGPQKVKRDTIRYCGTPLKYSFSEVSHKKSVTVVELLEKGNVQIRTVPLVPQHDMRMLRGEFQKLMEKESYLGTAVDDYLHITLTDEQEIPEAMGKLRSVYHNLMTLSYDNKRTRSNKKVGKAVNVQQKSPMDLFSELYEKQNGQEMSQQQRTFLEELIDKMQEEQL